MNKRYQVERYLQRFTCTRCGGSGEADDADLGDMYYNTFPCPDCAGTGVKDQETQL